MGGVDHCTLTTTHYKLADPKRLPDGGVDVSRVCLQRLAAGFVAAAFVWLVDAGVERGDFLPERQQQIVPSLLRLRVCVDIDHIVMITVSSLVAVQTHTS